MTRKYAEVVASKESEHQKRLPSAAPEKFLAKAFLRFPTKTSSVSNAPLEEDDASERCSANNQHKSAQENDGALRTAVASTDSLRPDAEKVAASLESSLNLAGIDALLSGQGFIFGTATHESPNENTKCKFQGAQGTKDSC